MYMCVCMGFWFGGQGLGVTEMRASPSPPPGTTSPGTWRGGLVFKAPRLCASLNCMLERNQSAHSTSGGFEEQTSELWERGVVSGPRCGSCETYG